MMKSWSKFRGNEGGDANYDFKRERNGKIFRQKKNKRLKILK